MCACVCMQGFMHVFMYVCVCVLKEHFVVPPQHTFTEHLLCARMVLDGSEREISASMLLRQMGNERASTEGALQCAAMRAVGQGTSDSPVLPSRSELYLELDSKVGYPRIWELQARLLGERGADAFAGCQRGIPNNFRKHEESDRKPDPFLQESILRIREATWARHTQKVYQLMYVRKTRPSSEDLTVADGRE